MDGGDCDWWLPCPRLQWNQLMPRAFSASREWDNRLLAPPSLTPCWGHKNDRHRWQTAVRTRLWDHRATAMTEWGRRDLCESRRRQNSSWIVAMETGLWVFVCCPIINYGYFNFGGWESKSRQFFQLQKVCEDNRKIHSGLTMTKRQQVYQIMVN